MEIAIRKVEIGDVVRVMSLMREFAEFEKLGEYCTVTEERLNAVIFGDNAFVEGLIALDYEKPIAYALFYPSFSTFRGERGLFLEDIYVSDEYRRHNLGEKMLREIARIAKQSGCERIDFHVLDWNSPAVNFYLKHGAERNDDDRHFKFAGDAFERLAA
jgi:GNAT superfamily N-acetyltransferase